ncbi:MAG: hypothetical protein B6D79_06650, partial [gamma proteobacterium symbiont of Ctena orbiculata]
MKGSGRILVSASFSLLLAMQGCGGGGGSSDDPADTNNPVNDDNVSDNTSDDFTGNESEAVVN